MNKSYFIRIDDLQPGMNKSILNNIIKYFEILNIKPLISVIPYSEKEDKEFWEIVRNLQNKGWIIGLHGYNHRLRINPNNTSSLIPIQNYSEFVGLPYKKQEEKIKNGLEIFKKYWIQTNIFIAPAHGLDNTTLEILKKYNINFVSDGFWLYPKKINGITFLPQQLWQFRSIPIGYKSICLHLENFKNLDNKILKKIKNNKEKLADFNLLLNIKTETFIQRIINKFFEKIWFTLLKVSKG